MRVWGREEGYHLKHQGQGPVRSQHRKLDPRRGWPVGWRRGGLEASLGAKKTVSSAPLAQETFSLEELRGGSSSESSGTCSLPSGVGVR